MPEQKIFIELPGNVKSQMRGTKVASGNFRCSLFAQEDVCENPTGVVEGCGTCRHLSTLATHMRSIAGNSIVELEVRYNGGAPVIEFEKRKR